MKHAHTFPRRTLLAPRRVSVAVLRTLRARHLAFSRTRDTRRMNERGGRDVARDRAYRRPDPVGERRVFLSLSLCLPTSRPCFQRDGLGREALGARASRSTVAVVFTDRESSAAETTATTTTATATTTATTSSPLLLLLLGDASEGRAGGTELLTSPSPRTRLERVADDIPVGTPLPSPPSHPCLYRCR